MSGMRRLSPRWDSRLVSQDTSIVDEDLRAPSVRRLVLACSTPLTSTRPHLSTACLTILSPSRFELRFAIASPPAFVISSTTTSAAFLLLSCADGPKSLTTTFAPREAMLRA